MLGWVWQERSVNTLVVRIKYAHIDNKTTYADDLVGIYKSQENVDIFHMMEESAKIIMKRENLSSEILDFIYFKK